MLASKIEQSTLKLQYVIQKQLWGEVEGEPWYDTEPAYDEETLAKDKFEEVNTRKGFTRANFRLTLQVTETKVIVL